MDGAIHGAGSHCMIEWRLLTIPEQEDARVTDDHLAILRLVNSKRSLPLVYADLREVLASRMPAKNMFVCIVEKDHLRFPYYVDELEPEDPFALFPKGGLTGYVIDTGSRYWLSHDPAPPATYVPVGPLPSDWIGVPVIGRDSAILGVLAVQNYESGGLYTDNDVEFVEYCADAISLAIQLAAQDRELAIASIAALVEETVDMDDFYPKIHKILQRVIPATRQNIIIARVDERAGLFRAVYWRDQNEDYTQQSWALDRGLSGYIYKVRKTSFVFETGKTLVPPEAVLGDNPSVYWLGAPLFGKKRIIGIVIIQSYDPSGIITREDEYTLNGICPHIATAIGKAELFDSIKRL